MTVSVETCGVPSCKCASSATPGLTSCLLSLSLRVGLVSEATVERVVACVIFALGLLENRLQSQLMNFIVGSLHIFNLVGILHVSSRVNHVGVVHGMAGAVVLVPWYVRPVREVAHWRQSSRVHVQILIILAIPALLVQTDIIINIQLNNTSCLD